MESVDCIFCHKPNDEVAIMENGYQGRRCVDCRLIYISPRPNALETAQLYSDEHAALYADAQLHFEQYKRTEASETLKIIQKFKANGTILELGAGGGSFLATARASGFVPYAIELNPIEAAWMARDLNIPCESAPLNLNSFQGKKFDIIYHRDVLSHLHDPLHTFEMINQSLQDKGLVIFETGNIADVNPRYLWLFSQFLYPDHLYFFGERSLRLLLERTGFECLKVYQSPIVLPLLLQKVLWRFKDSLKDGSSVDRKPAVSPTNHAANRRSVKRRVRLLYRYTSHYLSKLGEIFPKNGWPLKLVVVAQKKS